MGGVALAWEDGYSSHRLFGVPDLRFTKRCAIPGDNRDSMYTTFVGPMRISDRFAASPFTISDATRVGAIFGNLKSCIKGVSTAGGDASNTRIEVPAS
jgi:hypothetical protein